MTEWQGRDLLRPRRGQTRACSNHATSAILEIETSYAEEVDMYPEIDYYDDDEFFDDPLDDYGFCGLCEEDGLGVHYHCSNCDVVTSMLGHYDFASDSFKCEAA